MLTTSLNAALLHFCLLSSDLAALEVVMPGRVAAVRDWFRDYKVVQAARIYF